MEFKKAHTQTTEQVAMELDKETTINETQMSNVIDKMIEDKLTKQKKQLRKTKKGNRYIRKQKLKNRYP